MEEAAVGLDLGADSGAPELVTKFGQRAIVFGVEVGACGCLKEPGASVVVFLVAGEAGEARGCKPFMVVGEPLLEGGEIGWGEGFGVGQEGDRLGDFGQVHCFYEAFGTAGVCRWDDLGVEKAWCHAGCGVDEPCVEMGDGLPGVFVVFGENEGGGEGGNVEAEVEQSVAVGYEGFGIGRTGSLKVGVGW